MRKMIDIKQEELSDKLYPLLQQRSESHIKGLSGKLWTNFSPHDPGVTINDVLNYILSDLDFRLHYNLEDYLNKESDHPDLDEVGLFDRLQLELVAPVTSQDYETLMMEHIPEICHIEFNALADSGLLGLYDVKVFINPEMGKVDLDDVKAKIIRLFYDNRNLCEDIRSILFPAEQCDIKHLPQRDISKYLNDSRRRYPSGTYRDIFDYIPARMELPAFYGVNNWGLSSEATEKRKMQADQLKAYLSLFDRVVQDGLNDLKDLPRWFGLNTTLASNNGMKLKESLINNFERMYGEESNPSFMQQPDGKPESPQDCLKRRVDFLRLVPLWGRDRHKSSFLNGGDVYSLDAYIRKLLLLNEQENLVIVEHIFLRNSKETDELIIANDVSQEEFPTELSMSIFLYGKSKRMENRSFRDGLDVLIQKRVPAHISAAVYWLNPDEADKFEMAYMPFSNERSAANIELLKWSINEIREKNI